MSALGQKQTCAAHKVMSALPPKRTCALQLGMSASCHRTSLTSSRRFNGNEIIGCSRLAHTPARPCRETQSQRSGVRRRPITGMHFDYLCPQQRIGGTLHPSADSKGRLVFRTVDQRIQSLKAVPLLNSNPLWRGPCNSYQWFAPAQATPPIAIRRPRAALIAA